MTGLLFGARARVPGLVATIGLVISASTLPASAGGVIYQPSNPNFGGSPLNGSWLQSQASSQNEFQRRESRQQQLYSAIEAAKRAETSKTTELTQGQIFARQLQSQLYSSLANQITRAIFGENAKESGTFTFEGTTINFKRIDGNVQVDINDGSSITSVTVPAGL